MRPSFLLATIGVALAGLFGYHGIYAPQQGQARVIQAQIARETAHQRSQAAVAAVLEQVEQHRKRLPLQPDSSWLVREVLPLAQELGIQLTSIQPDPPQSLERYTSLTVQLQFTSSYHALGAFIDQIERAPSFLRVDQLELSQPDQASGEAVVHLTIGTVYVPPLRPDAAADPVRT